MTVWRKLSIRKCKSGEQCSHQEIENQQQLPAHLGKESGEVISIKLPKNDNNTTSKTPEVYNMADDSNGTNLDISSISTSKEGSRNSTDNDLIVGSLNLVRLICQ